MGFIYKITNKLSKKCYIGETKESSPETRWKQHIYNISKGRGCPALRDAVVKYGLENFTFEVLIICFDENRYDHERHYIKKYNSVVPNGYNILEGGEGGGFKGKHHTPEIIERLAAINRKRFEDPAERKKCSDRALLQMKEVKDLKVDWGAKVKSSEKYQLAVKEKRVGGGAHVKEKAKDVNAKISASVKKYFKTLDDSSKAINIKKHRESMAKAVGTKVQQFTIEGTLVKSYPSCSEAARQIGMSKSAIQMCVSGKSKTAGGFVWKKEVEPAVALSTTLSIE
jgi:group I intron endonuclease